MSEPTWTAIPDNRAVGSVNPPGDMDEATDELGLAEGILAILLNGSAVTPVGPQANRQSNISAISSFLTSTATAVLSTQIGSNAGNGVAGLDVSGLVPVAELPISSTTLFLSGTGTPASGTGLGGDYYLDVNTGNLWGPKTNATTWPGSAIGTLTGVLPGWTGMQKVATTGVSGYTMVAGAGNITGMTWTAPSDSAMHRVHVFANLAVTTTTVGGQINANFTDPGGTSRSAQDIITAGITAPAYKAAVAGANEWLIGSGASFTMVQTAMSSGAAVLYAEMWAS